MSASELQDLTAQAEREALDGLRRIATQVDGASCEVLVEAGDPRLVIPEVVTRLRADLLVMGTHGRSGLARALLGSVAESVAQAVSTDVLVVR